MTARAVATVAATVFVMALTQFFSALGGIWLALAGAAVLPFVALGLVKFFEAEIQPLWLMMAAVFAGTLSILIWFISHPAENPWFWACPAVTLALLAITFWWMNRDARRCSLCNGRLTGKVAFPCPRCGMIVCEAKCWDFERLRCRLCVQNQVPVFPPEGRWWDRMFGPATQYGRCQLCQATGDASELRNCPSCGRPQCRQCWDDSNGVCSRCKWVVSALPEALKGYMS